MDKLKFPFLFIRAMRPAASTSPFASVVLANNVVASPPWERQRNNDVTTFSWKIGKIFQLHQI